MSTNATAKQWDAAEAILDGADGLDALHDWLSDEAHEALTRGDRERSQRMDDLASAIESAKEEFAASR